jgi:hypothetical protein
VAVLGTECDVCAVCAGRSLAQGAVTLLSPLFMMLPEAEGDAGTRGSLTRVGSAAPAVPLLALVTLSPRTACCASVALNSLSRFLQGRWNIPGGLIGIPAR